MLPPILRSVPAALAMLALLPAAMVSADEVVLIPGASFEVPGGRLRGTITAESIGSIKIQPPTGRAQDVPVDQVASVTYDGVPSLALARTRESSGQLAEAFDLYKKAAGEASGKPLAVQAAQFGQARVLALQAMSDPARTPEATQALEAFIKAHPRGRHLGPALETLARLAMRRNDLDRAEKALADLGAIPGAADRAAVLKARVQIERGQAETALAALDRIVASARKGTPGAIEARLARAEVLGAMKKVDEAEGAVKEVIAELPPEDARLQALAHNTLGAIDRAAGRPKDALFAYLKTDILYSDARDQHPRALAEIAEIWRQLRRDDRADEALERLRREYPNSPDLPSAGGGR